MASPNPKTLHTIIRNCGLVKCRSLEPSRWFTGRELLIYQGFPVNPMLCASRWSKPRRSCSFCPELEVMDFLPNSESLLNKTSGTGYHATWVRKHGVDSEFAGNTMNLAILCAFQVKILMFTKRWDYSQWSCHHCYKSGSSKLMQVSATDCSIAASLQEP